MAIIGSILCIIASIGYLVCLIMVLIKMFPAEGTVKGILGIITCGIYAFIWGWMNAGRFNLTNILYGWTGCIVIYILGYLLGLAG